MRLPKLEVQLLRSLWRREKAFMKDLIDDFPGEKPKTTTVATILKRMIEKGLIAFEKRGNAREYYALKSEKEYISGHIKGFMSTFFDDSAAQFASFFTETTELSKEELESLRAMLDQQLKDKDA
ncbi:MAG: BlaI/MecI/CopY family transcriptional regulator [Bacteroidota bacterium]